MKLAIYFTKSLAEMVKKQTKNLGIPATLYWYSAQYWDCSTWPAEANLDSAFLVCILVIYQCYRWLKLRLECTDLFNKFMTVFNKKIDYILKKKPESDTTEK